MDEGMVGAGDIARAAGAGADARGSLNHCADHLRMLAHAQIVVGAPDHHVARPLRRMPHRVWETAGETFEVRENAVAPLVMQAVEGGTEELVVFHRKT